MEETVRNALKGIFPRDNLLEPIPQVRVRPPIISVRPSTEKKREWLPLDPESREKNAGKDDFFGNKEFGDLLKKEGTEKKQQNSLEEFYENLNRQNGLNAKRDSARDGFLDRNENDPSGRDRDGNSDSDDSKLPKSVRDAQQKLREAGSDLRASIFDNPGQRGGLSDIFGVDRTTPQPQTAKESNPYVTEYRQLLGVPPLKDSTSPVQPLPGFASSMASAPSAGSVNFDSALKPISSASENPMAWANPNRSLNVAPNVNSTVLNQWNPMYVPPPGPDMSARKMMTPPSMTDPLRRRF